MKPGQMCIQAQIILQLFGQIVSQLLVEMTSLQQTYQYQQDQVLISKAGLPQQQVANKYYAVTPAQTLLLSAPTQLSTPNGNAVKAHQEQAAAAHHHAHRLYQHLVAQTLHHRPPQHQHQHNQQLLLNRLV
jgi:hypothetical protein